MRKKHLLAFLSTAAVATTLFSSSTVVDAATMKLTHNSYVYNSKGKKTKHKLLRKGKKVKTSKLKKIKGKYYWKVGKNKYIRKANLKKVKKGKKYKVPDDEKYEPIDAKNISINVDKDTTFPSAKDMVANHDKLPAGTKYSWEEKPELTHDSSEEFIVNIKYPDGTTDQVLGEVKLYGVDSIKIPKGYTADELKKSEDNPTNKIIQASKEGNKENIYIAESEAEKKEKVDISNLTPDQKKRISEFVLKMINQAREQLGKSKWYYNNDVQSLADDIAAKYQKDGRGIQDDDHYVAGLVQVATEHGYDIGGVNQIEDMYGTPTDKLSTMYDLKAEAYDGVVAFLFNLDEYHHAADIMSCHNDENWNANTQNIPFAVSFSYVGGWNSVHYISIPHNVSR